MAGTLKRGPYGLDRLRISPISYRFQGSSAPDLHATALVHGTSDFLLEEEAISRNLFFALPGEDQVAVERLLRTL